jgi:membrane protease YdiL (CAAX protease family)
VVATAPPPAPPARTAGVARYSLAVLVTVVAVYSQYFVPQTWAPAEAVYGNLPGDLLVVYGLPIVAFVLLVGTGPLRNWADRMGTATYQGLLWYGGLSVVALVVTIALTIVYEAVDPAALQLLNRPNPAITQAAGNPWFWIGFSFVIGAVEEAIFRGWIFGFWQGRAADWRIPAVGSSALFAALHLYYGTTYGIAAPLIFPSLFFLGLAFAAAYQRSGGNLVVVALLHGAYDASAFYFAFVNANVGLLFRYAPVLAGVAVLLVDLARTPGAAPAPR